jgi:hypothetical protein
VWELLTRRWNAWHWNSHCIFTAGGERVNFSFCKGTVSFLHQKQQNINTTTMHPFPVEQTQTSLLIQLSKHTVLVVGCMYAHVCVCVCVCWSTEFSPFQAAICNRVIELSIVLEIPSSNLHQTWLLKLVHCTRNSKQQCPGGSISLTSHLSADPD